jgi:hypothetical protein
MRFFFNLKILIRNIAANGEPLAKQIKTLEINSRILSE